MTPLRQEAMCLLTFLMQWAVRATQLKLLPMFCYLELKYLRQYTRKFWEMLFPE